MGHRPLVIILHGALTDQRPSPLLDMDRRVFVDTNS